MSIKNELELELCQACKLEFEQLEKTVIGLNKENTNVCSSCGEHETYMRYILNKLYCNNCRIHLRGADLSDPGAFI